MNFLKGFGGSTNTAKPLSTSNNYFSSLKLQQEQANSKVKFKDNKKGQCRKGPPKDFIPNKFALSFEPPCIIFQYKDPSNNKLYHHKMNLKKLKKQTPTKDALQYLKKKHRQYFLPKVIDQGQIQKLVDKLKIGILTDSKTYMQDVQEQDDFDFDYDDDLDNL